MIEVPLSSERKYGDKDHLRLLSENEPLVLDPTDGLETLGQATTPSNTLIPISTVGAVAWRGGRLQKPPFGIYEMAKDCTFQDSLAVLGWHLIVSL